MFDITGGELLVIFGAATFMLGKKELPMLARMAGRGTGRFVALLNSARDQFTRATEETGLSGIKEAVQQDMYELSNIRHEIRAAGTRPQAGLPPLRTFPSQPASLGMRGPGGVGAASSYAPTAFPANVATPPPSAYASPVGMKMPSPPPLDARAVHDVGAPVSGDVASSSVRLGQLAMAEILIQEKEASGQMSPSSTQGRGKAAPQESEMQGSDVLDEVILETIMRDHIDRISGGGKV